MKNYEIQISKEKFEESIKLVKENSTVFSHNTDEYNFHQGKFSIQGVKGNFGYSEIKEKLIIEIHSKPFIASRGMIESKLNQFFAS